MIEKILYKEVEKILVDLYSATNQDIQFQNTRNMNFLKMKKLKRLENF